jgi:hypothetical protein
MVIPRQAPPDYLSLADLAGHGLTAADIRVRCPGATELTGLDGLPCWRAEDLEALRQGAGHNGVVES